MNFDTLQQACLNAVQQLGNRGLGQDKDDAQASKKHLENLNAGRWPLRYDNADDLGTWLTSDENMSQKPGLVKLIPLVESSSPRQETAELLYGLHENMYRKYRMKTARWPNSWHDNPFSTQIILENGTSKP